MTQIYLYLYIISFIPVVYFLKIICCALSQLSDIQCNMGRMRIAITSPDGGDLKQ